MIPEVLPEILLARNDAEVPFKSAGGDIGFRSKIGGNPTGIDQSDFPKCSSCGRVMIFYGQLDSVSDDIVIADCGLIATFICFDCYEVKAEITSF